MSKSYRVIRPDRYVRLEPVDAAVSVMADGERLLLTDAAHHLYEGDREPVVYVPLASVPDGALTPNDRTYDCRWKGTAHYFDVTSSGRTWPAAAWRYVDPPEDLAELGSFIAFDTAQLEVRVQPLDGATA